MERKASDVLLDIERKIDLVLQYQKTNDLNYKLILDRLNKLIAASSEIQVVSKPSEPKKMLTMEAYITPTPPIAAAPKRTVLIPKPVVNYEFHEVDEDGKPQIQEDLQPKAGRRDVRTPIQPDKKTQVQQKIVYPDSKNVILASVEIFSTVMEKGKPEKKLVKQTRTNSSGKWIAALDPGKYSIRVFKSATSNKPVVEQQYEVEIPLSEEPMELEPLQV